MPFPLNPSATAIPAVKNLSAQCLHVLITEGAISQELVRPSPEIASLTAAMAKSDETAYRKFYELYFNRLLRYLLVLTRDEDSARDALQSTLLRVAKHAKRFDTEEVFWSWLTVLARSSVVDQQRKTTRYGFFLARFFQHKQIESSMAGQESDAQLLEFLESNLAAIPEEERDLIRRKYFDGESVREIAEELRQSEKAIESRLVRIRRKLKDLILVQLKNEK